MQINIFILFALICGVRSVQPSKDDPALNKKLFHAFLEEIYGNGYRMEYFINLMWPTIKAVVPESVKLPATEVYAMDTDKYSCATESNVSVKIGRIINQKQLLSSKDKVFYEVEAELMLDSKPVQFGIAMHSSPGKTSPTVVYNYLFKGPNKVKFVLEIYNFIRKRSIITPQCLIKVKNVMVEKVSEPQLVSTVPSVHPGLDLFRNFELDEREVLFTIGLVKAISERLSAQNNFWVCPSMFLKKVQEGYEPEWRYSPNYYKYCLKEEGHKHE